MPLPRATHIQSWKWGCKGLASQPQVGMAMKRCSLHRAPRMIAWGSQWDCGFPVSLPSLSAHSCSLPFSSLGADSKSILRKTSISCSVSKGTQLTMLLIPALLKTATWIVLISTPWKTPYKGWVKGPHNFLKSVSLLCGGDDDDKEKEEIHKIINITQLTGYLVHDNIYSFVFTKYV